MASRKESVMSMIQLDVETDTTTTRHTQWRRLSRKRRRTLIKRALRKLEQEAGEKYVRIGMDDYSHVQSLVYSELPFNPNGHHCSCNCLDEVRDDPELEVYGWNYGRLLKSSEQGYYGDNEEDRDDVLLSEYSATLSALGSPEKGLIKTERSSRKSFFESMDGYDAQNMGDDSARSTMGGTLELKPGSEATAVQESPRNEMTDASRFSIHSFANHNGSPETVSEAVTERIDLDKEKTFRSIYSSRDTGRSGISRNKSRTGSKKGCYCDRFAVGSKTTRRSIASGMSRLSSRTACSKCQHFLSAVDNLRHLNSSRQITLAKEEGLLRSKIFGLRQQLKHYDDIIQKNDYNTIQSKVKRKLQIRDAQQKKALLLSDNLKLMKVEELLYRKNNEILKERLAEEGGSSQADDALGEEETGKEYDQNFNFTFKQSGFNRSPRKTGKNHRGTGLPAVMEENEEDVREGHSSNRKRPINYVENHAVPSFDDPYEILFINHSDNEAESKSKNYTNGDNNYDDEDGEDIFMRTWPAYKRDSLKLGFWGADGRDSVASIKTVKLKKPVKADPVRRIVHRLDSGLSYGISSTESELVADESFLEIKDKIDEQKISGSYLPEDEYYKPLVERQRSFGDIIKNVIKKEIARRASDDSGKTVNAGHMFEDEEIKDKLKKELTRRRSLSQIEGNHNDLVEKAEKKNEKLLQELRENYGKGANDVTEDASSVSTPLKKISEKSEERKHEEEMGDEDIGESAKMPKPGRFVDLSTLRTLAQKHQTLRSLGRLEEEEYKLSSGVEKLNTYRKSEARARVQSQESQQGYHVDTELPLSAKEKKFSIPAPQNIQSKLEEKIAENDKKISRIDFEYDMMRDLRFLILNQNMNRAFTWSYLKAAPPYLKKKWQGRIKRGFLRGVKEQKLNEVQLEKVEDVTLKNIDRSQIHKVTLTNEQKKRRKSTDQSGSRALSQSSRPLSRRRQSENSTEPNTSDSGNTLPPLKLPNSRESSPVLTSYDRRQSTANADGVKSLKGAFRKLSLRHKFIEKTGLMRNVIKLSSYSKNEGSEIEGFLMPASDRSRAGSESEERFTSRLKQQQRRHSIATQNFASSDPLSGRLSVNSVDKRRKLSLMQPISEF
eukprot:gene12349-3000_t